LLYINILFEFIFKFDTIFFNGNIDIFNFYKFYIVDKTFSIYHDSHLSNYMVIILSILLIIHMFPIIKTTAQTAPGDSSLHIGSKDSTSSPSTTATANPACGQIVKGNVKLISNLICNNDGLIVGDANTKIDLNGFSIKGPGKNSSKVGIMVGSQKNIIILGNGVISGFQSGIYLSGSNDVLVKNININNNKVAIYITGAKFTDINNNMLNNNTLGIASHSNNQTSIKYNLFNENDLSGITFINTADSIIDGNNILNTTNGIFLDAQSSSNKVDFNNVFDNVLDINNANNLPLNINNNYFANNNCITSLPSGLCIGR
jgi:parallel beta-helix repeat protein